jgi:murein hydrolase activator
MKKLLLSCILFCGMLQVLSAQHLSKSSKTKTKSKTQVAKKKTKSNKKNIALSKKSHTRPATAKKGVIRHSKSKNRKGIVLSSSRTGFATYGRTDKRKKESSFDMSPEDARLGSALAHNRGKLPWPVDGVVSIPYGDYTVEGTKIRGRNPGITISTSDTDVPVRSVFDGVVSDVDQRGEVSSIFIRHGKYYTVYSNLSGINVTKGTIVKTGDMIGTVGNAYAAPGGELTFLIMENDDNVNPATWLTRAE